MLVANKVTCFKYFKGDENYTKNFDKYILMKQGNTISIQDINCTQKSLKNDKTIVEDVRKDTILNNAGKDMDKDEDRKEKESRKETDNVQKPVKNDNKEGLANHARKESVVDEDNKIELRKKKASKKDTDNVQKPVITENILLKIPIKVQNQPGYYTKAAVKNKVNQLIVKPHNIMKLETVPTLQKLVWCPRKRSFGDASKDNVKKSKNT